MLTRVVVAMLMTIFLPVILGLGVCAPGSTNCRVRRDWRFGVDPVNPRGAKVYGQVNSPVSSGGFQGSAFGSRVFGGPSNGATSFGGGVNYQNPGGLQGGLDFTHTSGQGNVFSGSVGGSTRLGPGTLTVKGGISSVPHSGNAEVYYTVPLK